MVFCGELLGVSLIVGAFIAGMAMVRVPGFQVQQRILHKQIEGIGYGFLIPFLFLTVGMKTDLKVLFTAWQNAALVLITVVGLVGSKVLSGWLAMRLSGFSNAKSVCAGLMTVPQLSATLAAAAVALELELLPPAFFNAIVCLSVITTIPAPILVRYIIISWQVKFDQLEEQIAVTMPEMDLEEELV